MQRNDLRWELRACVIFCYLHPLIFGSIEDDYCHCKKTAEIGGVSKCSIAQWTSLKNKMSLQYVLMWYYTVKTLTWGKVKESLSSDFTNKFDIDNVVIF